MIRSLCVLLCGVLLSASVSAQEPVNRAADWAGYATAAINPTMALIHALRGPHPWCHVGRIALSGGIGNTAALAIKQEVRSPRPCTGCDTKGMPSQHAVNSMIGSGWNYRVSWTFSVGTGALRYVAHRHTSSQVVAGLLIGFGADQAGRLIPCGD